MDRHSFTMRQRRGASLAAIGLAALAAAALVVRNRTRKVEREHPPTGRFVQVDGMRLHYVERGEGRPLVLLHGNFVTEREFELSGLLDMAARDYRVIAFDRPGFGYSERPRGTRIFGPQAQAQLIARALRKLGVERPIVLGHSWGAMVAISMALDHPESVASLVLESGYYYPTLRPDALIAAPLGIPLLGDLMLRTVTPLQFRMTWPLMVKQMFRPSPIPDHFRRYPPWMSARPAQLRASAVEMTMAVPAAMRLQSRYRGLRVPAVIIAGREDRQAHADAHSERLHAELPMSELVLVDGMGHMLHHLTPARVLQAIDAAARMAEQADAGSMRPPTPAPTSRELRLDA
jgi:pimeloyl-ACP methyl ester carboxylesterase